MYKKGVGEVSGSISVHARYQYDNITTHDVFTIITAVSRLLCHSFVLQ